MTPDLWPAGANNATVLPANWNRYAYVGGDPVNKSDPSGLCSPDDNPPCFDVTVTAPVDPETNPGDIAVVNAPGSPGVDWLTTVPSYYTAISAGPPPTTGNNAALTILNAERGAADRLFNPDCAGLFLAPDANTAANRAQLSGQLDAIENAGLIRQIGPQALPAGSSPNLPAFTTGPNGLIYIVTGGAFFTGQVNGNPLGGFAAGMQLTNFEQLVIIHEFLHWEGVAGPDASGQKYTLPNGDTVGGSAGISKEIKKKCFN